jgi:hypothetical protein
MLRKGRLTVVHPKQQPTQGWESGQDSTYLTEIRQKRKVRPHLKTKMFIQHCTCSTTTNPLYQNMDIIDFLSSGLGYSSVVEHLPRIPKTLGLNLQNIKKKKSVFSSH